MGWCEGDRGRTKSLSENWNCDRGIWGSGSGGEGGAGHADHGGGGLPDGGKGTRARDQPDFGRAPGDGGIWGEKACRLLPKY